jgi:hypothetical protein
MPNDAATAIAYVGAFVGLIGGGVALFNSWKAVRWKRAELANNYLKELNANQELVFACRSIKGLVMGRLVVPESLWPLLDDKKFIDHNPSLFHDALKSNLHPVTVMKDPRLFVYRTSMHSLFSWLILLNNALDRKLFYPEDISEVRRWISSIENHPFLPDFISWHGYEGTMRSLKNKFDVKDAIPVKL